MKRANDTRVTKIQITDLAILPKIGIMKAAAKGMAKNNGINVTLASLSFQFSDLCNIESLVPVVDSQNNS